MHMLVFGGHGLCYVYVCSGVSYSVVHIISNRRPKITIFIKVRHLAPRGERYETDNCYTII